MKIIGTTTDKYLLEATPEEVAKLQDQHPSHWSPNQRCIGTEFDIATAWSLLSTISLEREELAKTANKLRAVADLLQPIACEIPSVAEETEENADV